MELTNEDIVTRMLSEHEILQSGKRDIFISHPKYDLNLYMKTYVPEPSRFGEKYIFVK